MTEQKNYSKMIFLILLAVGVFVRVYSLGSTPTGFNQDEAFAAYEAFSLANYGVDSFGYPNPCYLTAWGSGMNALESYLAIPFIKYFGSSIFIFRLPQLILCCISLYVFYKLLINIFDETTALIGLFLTVISPWHIMISHWALESNLAPSFLLFGLYFLILGFKNNKYFILSAIFYGLSLYSYAITWLVVPLTLILVGIYILISKQKFNLKIILISAIILFILALPLMLFILVNKGFISEIITPFISIPKMLVMRDGEVSIKNLLNAQSYINLYNVVIKQNDELPWNTIVQFGLYYKISIIFMIIGLYSLFSKANNKIKNKEFSFEIILILGFISSIISCLSILYLNANKANSLHFYILILITLGIKQIFDMLKQYNIIKATIILSYIFNFILFSSFYFFDYNQTISPYFKTGVKECIEYAKSLDNETISVDYSIYYPQVLFYDQTPHDIYSSTVEYSNYPAAFLSVSSFANYEFISDYNHLYTDKTYIIPNSLIDTFKMFDFTITSFENYSVAHYNQKYRL